MSRIGKKKIQLPRGVEFNLQATLATVKGPKGQLSQRLHPSVSVEKLEGELSVLVSGGKDCRKYHGLSRTLISNMVQGVTEGFSKNLTLIGIGYRASMAGADLNLTLGYSHPVVFKAPKGISLAVDKQTTVIVSGADKMMVGQVAADIRSFRPPEPYHGKGIRYADEVIVTKVGKSGGK